MLPDPFAPGLTGRRREALRDLLASDHAGAALVVEDPANIRYLTGFDGSHGALLVVGGDAQLFTDSRYTEQAAQQAPGVAVTRAADALGAAVAAAGGSGTLVEAHRIPAGRWLSLAGENPSLRLAPDLVGDLRAIKDDAECAVLAHACLLSERALEGVLAEGVLGRSERQVARRLEWLLGDGLGEGPGFPSIVAAGPNSALPHHRPTDRQLERGDLLKIDFGSRVLGYHADITRTFVVAADPEAWQRDIHRLVHDAQAAALAAVRAGAAIADIDAGARGLIASAGHGGHFGHGLGHGVGLAIHERPLVAGSSTGTLAAGMAITIEPGIYLPGRGGVRIEDTVLVEDAGYRSLVALPRELAVVH